MAMLIRTRPASDVDPHDITDESVYMRRREFLCRAACATGAVAGTALLPGATLAAASSRKAEPDVQLEKLEGARKSHFSTDEPPTGYDDATRYNNFYEFGTGKEDPARYARRLVTKPWSVAIEGAVEKPGVVPLEDLLKPHTLEERIYRLRCVEAWSMVIPWLGIALGDVLARFRPTSAEKRVGLESAAARPRRFRF